MNSNLHKYRLVTHYFAIFASVLLLLSSCAVKQSLADVIGIGFEKPLNPSKAAGSAASCTYTDVETNSIVFEAVKQQHLNSSNSYAYKAVVASGNCFKSNSSCEPLLNVPLYILYKKLKYDMA